MGKFITHSIFFVLGYLVLNGLFYMFVTTPAVYTNYVFNEDNMDQYHSFLVSDSHGACMKSIPNEYGIYNFSYRGDNYLDMYLKVQYLATQLSTEDTIFLNVDSHLFSNYRDKSSNAKKNIIYANYQVNNLLESEEVKQKLNNKKYFKYLPLLDIDYGVFYYDYLLPEKAAAYHRSFADYNEKTQRTKCQRRYETQYQNKTKSEKQEQYLEKIIEICEEKNIKLIGIQYPLAKMYWNMIENNNYNTTSLLKQYGIEVYDFHDLFFEQTDCFYDQDHLNLKGSKLFCEQISKLRRD